MARDIKRRIAIPYAYAYDDITAVDPLYNRQILDYNRPSDPFNDILHEILINLRTNYNHYYGDSRDYDEALHRMFKDKELFIKVFAHPSVLRIVVDIYADHMEQQKKSLSDKEAKISTNGIKHEDYEAAVDIVDDFDEMGLDTLDEGQLEIYEENLEIVKEYERS